MNPFKLRKGRPQPEGILLSAITAMKLSEIGVTPRKYRVGFPKGGIISLLALGGGLFPACIYLSQNGTIHWIMGIVFSIVAGVVFLLGVGLAINLYQHSPTFLVLTEDRIIFPPVLAGRKPQFYFEDIETVKLTNFTEESGYYDGIKIIDRNQKEIRVSRDFFKDDQDLEELVTIFELILEYKNFGRRDWI